VSYNAFDIGISCSSAGHNRRSWLNTTVFFARQFRAKRCPPGPELAVVGTDVDASTPGVANHHRLNHQLCVPAVTTAYATARSVASPRPTRGDPRTQPADPLADRHDPPPGRHYVIEHCWLRRIAPCSDPTSGPGEDMTKQPSGSLDLHNPWGTGDDQRNASSPRNTKRGEATSKP